MTGMRPNVRMPDPVKVLKRVDDRLEHRTGHHPLTPAALVEYAGAIQKQIINPLLDAGSLVDLEQLRGELEKVRAAAADRYDELNLLREQRTALWELLKDCARERRQAWAEAARLEHALDERSAVDDERHQHHYPVEKPGDTPTACRCGRSYPRAHLVDAGAYEPDPWTRFFGGLEVTR